MAKRDGVVAAGVELRDTQQLIDRVAPHLSSRVPHWGTVRGGPHPETDHAQRQYADHLRGCVWCQQIERIRAAPR